MEGISSEEIARLNDLADKDGLSSEVRQCILRGIQQVKWLREILEDLEQGHFD